MTKSDQISVTFVYKDFSIKEMLLSIKNRFTTFMNNDFIYFSSRMEVEDKLEAFNPWKVENIDQFLNYCCPECDTKQRTKSDFIVHAIDAHPDSREYLPLFDYEEEKDHHNDLLDLQDGDELSDIEIKEKDVSSIVPLKTEFSASNSVTVKLEPLSMNSLLEMECDEEDCGRFFVTQEAIS